MNLAAVLAWRQQFWMLEACRSFACTERREKEASLVYKESNVTVMVSDIERAVQFYTEALGLPLKTRAGDEWAEVQAPGLTIALHPASQYGPQPGQAGSLSI